MSRWIGFAFVLAWSVWGGPGCASGGPPAVPLYPDAESSRLPAGQVASVVGPIAMIDGRDVSQMGGWFDLLPGCHVIELQRQSSSSFILGAGGMHAKLAATVYALRMKAGAHYVIQQDVISGGNGSSLRVARSAREELPGGATTDIDPVKSRDDVPACRDWAATLHG